MNLFFETGSNTTHFTARRWCSLLSVLIISGISSCMAQHDKLDDELKSLLKGSVPYISPKEVKQQLENDKIVMLDIRTDEEQKVSHIPGARMVIYENFSASDVSSIPKDDTVIVYCSVGYRSEKIGEKMQEMGYSHVFNLYGGIFEWKNEGFEVVSENGEKTDSVHTYNKAWSKYLENGIKVYD